MNRIFLFAIAGAIAILAIGISVEGATSSAKKAPHPGGSRDNCSPDVAHCNDPHLARVVRNGIIYNLPFDGGMWIECVDTGTTISGLWWWKQMVIGFSGTTFDPILGTIHIDLDSTRNQDTSMIVSNVIGQNFPATHDVYAHARVTFSSEPGIIYRSKNPFHMFNNAITSFAVPGQPQTYNVANDVEFENVALPGPVVFTMVPTPMTVFPL